MAKRICAMFDVVLRVPCIFAINAILNSFSDLSFEGLDIVPQILLRLWGVLLSSVILVLSQEALFRVYRFSFVLLLAVASALVNYHATLHTNFYHAYYSAAFGAEPLPGNGPSVWTSITILQLTFGVAFVSLLQLHSINTNLIILNLLLPVTGLILESPEHILRTLVLISGLVLTLQTALFSLSQLETFYYDSQYAYCLIKLVYRDNGLESLLEATWKRSRFPDVLRVFWLTRLATQAVIMLHVLKKDANDDASYLISWADFWVVAFNLITSGCDSTLTVMGMSAVISAIAHDVELGILSFIGSTEEEDEVLCYAAPVFFFIWALQTGLSGLKPEERLVHLSRNMCLLLTKSLHFVHRMTQPVLTSLSASHVPSVRRHLPVLVVSTCLFELPIFLSFILWNYYVLNSWLFAMTAHCVALCLKILLSLTIYTLYMVDGYYNVLRAKLDDYEYYVLSTDNIMRILFGCVIFGNGAYTVMFDSVSIIQVSMMCLEAYCNIYLRAKDGWKTWSTVKKINSLPEIKASLLSAIDDVCYHEFQTAACVTPCHHYFHVLCLRKWLSIQNTCPRCLQKVYLEN